MRTKADDVVKTGPASQDDSETQAKIKTAQAKKQEKEKITTRPGARKGKKRERGGDRASWGNEQAMRVHLVPQQSFLFLHVL